MTAGSLTCHNTLRVDAAAGQVVTVSDEAALLELVAARRGGEALTILGGGSNVVLRARIDGTVALLRTRGWRLDRAADAVDVTAAAGVRWHDLVRFTLGRGLAGLENLALIPGSVGAAPIQNVGAYGRELAERLLRLRVLDRQSGRVHVMGAADCRFGYRDSLFKSPEGAGLIVLDVTVRLHRRGEAAFDYPDLQREIEALGWSRPTPVQVAEAVIRVRRRKLPDPRRIGNAGSFFKNPLVDATTARRVRERLPALSGFAVDGGLIKLSAAQLIDACGWKGRRIGDVAVWHRQPLVLCNLGSATGRDVLAVSEDIRADVRQRFGVNLEREPQVLGYD